MKVNDLKLLEEFSSTSRSRINCVSTAYIALQP